MEQIYDMIIIGGGPAGYTAALYAARAGLSTLVLEKLSAGGQMALTEQIDNYPGFESGIDGFTLGEKMQQSAERFGAVTELAEVYKASLSGKIKTLDTSEGVFQSSTVVIATGASPRPNWHRTNPATSSRTNPPEPASPACSPRATYAPRRCGRWSPPYRTARRLSTTQRNIWQRIGKGAANDPLIGSSCPQATRLRAMPHRGAG